MDRLSLRNLLDGTHPVPFHGVAAGGTTCQYFIRVSHAPVLCSVDRHVENHVSGGILELA